MPSRWRADLPADPKLLWLTDRRVAFSLPAGMQQKILGLGDNNMPLLPVIRFLGVALMFSQSAAEASQAQTVAGTNAAAGSEAYQSLRYRLVGPFRAGRTVGAVGIECCVRCCCLIMKI